MVHTYLHTHIPETCKYNILYAKALNRSATYIYIYTYTHTC